MSKILQFYRRREEYVDLFSETQRFKVYTERHLENTTSAGRTTFRYACGGQGITVSG